MDGPLLERYLVCLFWGMVGYLHGRDKQLHDGVRKLRIRKAFDYRYPGLVYDRWKSQHA